MNDFIAKEKQSPFECIRVSLLLPAHSLSTPIRRVMIRVQREQA